MILLCRSRFAIFLLSISLRILASWQVAHDRPIPRFWHQTEVGSIAKSIVEGRGFASPYDEKQPTAWVGPIYPWVVAFVFRIFGIYSAASTYFLILLNVLFSGLTSLVIYAIGRRAFGVEVGAAAGLLWALCLPAAVMPLLIWDTCFSALLLSLGFLLMLRLKASSSYLPWGATGLFWGSACLVNPALIAPLLLLWLFGWFRGLKAGRNVGRELALSIVLFLAVVAPWLVRNYRVFGEPVFVRSNLAAEIYFGNLGFDSHPFGETMEYQRLGEIAYVAEKRQSVLQYVENNFSDFAKRSLYRVVEFWTVPRIAQSYWTVISLCCFSGLILAFREDKFKTIPFLIVFLTYPVAYYVSYVFPKYRHPIEPLMFVLAACTIAQLAKLSGCCNVLIENGRICVAARSDEKPACSP